MNNRLPTVAFTVYVAASVVVAGGAFVKKVTDTPLQLLSFSDYCPHPDQERMTLYSSSEDIVATFMSTTGSDSSIVLYTGI